MASGKTIIHGFPIPLETDVPDVAKDADEFGEAIDKVIAIHEEGLASARPVPGVKGRFYRATDTGVLSFDTGVAWIAIDTNTLQDVGGHITTATAEKSASTYKVKREATGRYRITWTVGRASEEYVLLVTPIPNEGVTACVISMNKLYAEVEFLNHEAKATNAGFSFLAREAE